ncbi:glycosyltransferase family 4 protein [Dyadobacter sp. CY261]|uniref:glycosyltransferase family 4 protein n=1 Tax=Dyadobacter sp. CY261 TaxID=2907203 RepID=UPI001F3D5D55|nr:glycosyltransferase family 4 protein [Dyadobacter sp. CY261]MCF0073070.1 glycosyltransferase family 4 protein [Dyadobacter sp. CY261]
MKILAIHNILWSHYKAKIFTELHQRLQKEGTNFFVLQLAFSELSRLGLKTDLSIHTYPYEVLFPEKAIEQIGHAEKTQKLLAALRHHRPDIVYLNGYYDPSYWFVMGYCAIKKIKIVLDFESSEISRRRVWWKEGLKKMFLHRFDGLVCLGQKAAEYAQKLGVPRERIMTVKNVGVDNDALLEIFSKELPQRGQRKAKMHLPRYNFLYAGRFVERKNLDRFIRAFHEAKSISANGNEWGLILSGEGNQKPRLQELIRSLDSNSVYWMEPCEWYEVPIRYTLADVAVLPSTFEPFGFLTNEAMVYSMPVLVSERCGSAHDLVIDGLNGFRFDPFNQSDFTSKLLWFMEHPEKFRQMGSNGKAIIDQWSPDIITEELIQSFHKVSVHG